MLMEMFEELQIGITIGRLLVYNMTVDRFWYDTFCFQLFCYALRSYNSEEFPFEVVHELPRIKHWIYTSGEKNRIGHTFVKTRVQYYEICKPNYYISSLLQKFHIAMRVG